MVTGVRLVVKISAQSPAPSSISRNGRKREAGS